MLTRALRVLFVLALLPTGNAVAQSGRAKKLIQHGDMAYQIADYTTALADYKAAYDASPIPSLLVLRGDCHRALGQHAEAAAQYRAYLTAAPKAADRAKIEAQIAVEDQYGLVMSAPPEEPPKKLVDSPAPVPAAVDLTAQSPQPVPFYRRWYLWAGAGAVVLIALAVGLGVGLSQGGGGSAGGVPSSTLTTVDAR
jgi:tetratricopeptide (TPR) repeat protein